MNEVVFLHRCRGDVRTYEKGKIYLLGVFVCVGQAKEGKVRVRLSLKIE